VKKWRGQSQISFAFRLCLLCSIVAEQRGQTVGEASPQEASAAGRRIPTVIALK